MDRPVDRQTAQKPLPSLANRPVPERPLRLHDATLQGRFGVFLIGVCIIGCLLVALLASFSVAREQSEYKRLRQAGLTIQAQVISRTDVGRGSDRLTYRFTLPSPASVRRSYEGTTIVDRSLISHDPSGHVSIVYDPANPRVSRLSDDDRPPASVFQRVFPFLWLGWLPLVAGVLTVLVGRGRQELARQLEQRGQLVSAIVIERWHAQGQARGQPGGPCLTYQFDVQLPDGQTRRVVKAEIVDRAARFQRLQVGAPVQVRYLPDNPTVCRIEWS